MMMLCSHVKIVLPQIAEASTSSLYDTVSTRSSPQCYFPTYVKEIRLGTYMSM